MPGEPSRLVSRARAARAALRGPGVLLSVALVSAACVRPHVPSVPPAPRGSQSVLAVATWNLHAGRGDLPRFLGDFASGVLTGTPPREYIVLLQEDVDAAAESLAARRGLDSFFAPVRTDGARVSGNAILSTLPLRSPSRIELLRERQPRAAAIATITFAGETLFLVNLHLENRLVWWRGLFSDTARGRQAGALLEALPMDGHGILGGDLNTWLGPREPAWRALAARFPDAPAGTPQPTFHHRLVLDHLFFDLPDGWVATRRVIGDSYGSDHQPLVAIVTAATASARTN